MFDLVKLVVFVIYAFYSFKWLHRHQCSPVLKFVFWLVLGRLVLASFHNITYTQLFGPFSIMSLYSIFMTGSSFLFLFVNKQSIYINRNHMLIKLILLLMCISAIVNGGVLATVPSFIKWTFLLLFISLLLMSIQFNGTEKVLKTLFIAYSYPAALLILSVLLGESKASESDGSTSYIGGYFHEAVFSVMIFTGVMLYFGYHLVSVHAKNQLLIPAIIVFILLLALINYRTTLIAAMLTFSVVLYAQYIKQQSISGVFYFFIGLGFVFIISIMDLSAVLERFAEIPQAIMNISALMDYPEYYTKEDRRFFSGRAYMWSNYIAEALDGTSIQFFVGQGMDSWKQVFLKYAHNTFVSFFYELGIVGVSLLVALFSRLYLSAMKIKVKQHKLYLTGFFLSFTFLNLGTMPIWQMEGIMFFAILIVLIQHLKRGPYVVK